MDLKSYIDIELRTDTQKKSKQIEADLNRVDKASKKSGDEIKRTGNQFSKSTTQASKGLDKTTKSAKKTQTGVKGLAGGFKGLVASISPVQMGIAGLGVVLLGSVKTFATFNQSIADLSAITGATGNDLKFYSDAAREMGAVTTLSASEVADAFRLVASAKPDLLSNAEALKAVTKQAITLAEAAGITVPEAANTMASALNQFGQNADQAARFTNVLAAGSKFGAASIAEMGESLRESGTAAASMGLDFEETNAALQLLSTNAIKGGSAGTQLRGVLLALETKTEDFRPSVLGVSEALRQYGAAGFETGEQLKVFGRLNLTAGQILTENADKFDALRDSVTGTDIANEQAAIRVDTLNGAMKRLGSAGEELALVLTDDSGVGAGLQILVDGLATLVNATSLAIGGVIDLTKYLWDLADTGPSVNSVFGDMGVSMSWIKDNSEELAAVIGGDIIKAMSVFAQIGQTGFALWIKLIKDVKNEFLDMGISVLKTSGKIGPLFDKIFGTKLTTSIGDSVQKLQSMKSETKSLGATILEVDKKFSLFRKGVDESTDSTLSLITASKNLIQETEASNIATEEAAELAEANAKAAEKAAEKIQTVVEALQDEREALERTDVEQEIYLALKEAEVEINSEAGEQIRDLVLLKNSEEEAIEAVADAQKQATKDAKELAKESQKAAQEVEDAWASRRDTLSDFFFEFAKDGMGAFDTLVEGFKSMIVKMIADAAANKIILGVTSVLAGSVGSAAAAGDLMGPPAPGGAMTDQVSSAMSLLTDGFAAAGQGMYQSIGSGLSNLGMTGLGDMAYTKGLNTTGLTMAGDFAGGYAGAYLGEKVFGEPTGIGSTVGGVVGSILLPPVIGAAIGSFVGTAVESLFSGDNNGDNRGRSNFDLAQAGGNVNSFGEGKSFNQDNVDLADTLSSSLVQIAEMFGGSDLAGEIAIGNNSGISFNGGNFGTDVDAFLFSATQDIIQGSEEISQAVKDVVLSFEGTAGELAQFALTQIVIEDLIAGSENLNATMEGLIRNFEGTTEDSLLFAQSMTNLSDVISSNAVDDAALFAAENFKIAQDGVLGTYNSLTSAAVDAMVAYDGSAGSLSDLNNAMVMSKTAAFQLALEIGRLSESLVSMFETSASSIREQLMSEAQLSAARTAERDATLLAIQEMTNPEGIAAAAKRVNELNDLLFRELSEEDKKLFGADFAEFADEAGAIVKEQLDGTLALVEDSQEALMTYVGTLLNDTGKINRDAADVLLDAAKIILNSANTPVVVEVNVETSGAVTG